MQILGNNVLGFQGVLSGINMDQSLALLCHDLDYRFLGNLFLGLVEQILECRHGNQLDVGKDFAFLGGRPRSPKDVDRVHGSLWGDDFSKQIPDSTIHIFPKISIGKSVILIHDMVSQDVPRRI